VVIRSDLPHAIVAMLAVSAAVGISVSLSCSASRLSGDTRAGSPLAAQDARIRTLERIRSWSWDKGDFIAPDEVDRDLGTSSQPHAWFDELGSRRPRVESTYPLNPGTSIWVVFCSTAESKRVAERRMAELERQAVGGKIDPGVYAAIVDAHQRSLRALKRYEGACLLRDAVPYHAVFAELSREPIEQWRDRIEFGAIGWLQLGDPASAAQLFETAAQGEGPTEQLLWKAAVARTAAGHKASALANLARFKAAASPEQLSSAADAISDIESRITALPES
jgi:hypothetical protein